MAAFTLTDQQQVPVTITFLDAAGQPAAVTNPQVSVTDPAILALAFTPAADPTAPVTSITATIAAAGPIGMASLNVSATASDGTSVAGSQDFAITDSGAKSVVFTMGTPAPLGPVS